MVFHDDGASNGEAKRGTRPAGFPSPSRTTASASWRCRPPAAHSSRVCLGTQHCAFAHTQDFEGFSAVDDGSYLEGTARKAITLTVKDSKKYASTGGWGFQPWAGGDATKPIATDPVKQCFSCHTPQKAQDFTFSKYLE